MKLLVLASVVLAASSACSSFEADWIAAKDLPVSGARPLTGRWAGTWMSDENGHHGSVRAIVSFTGDDTYDVRYHATYADTLTFEFLLPLETAASETGVQFDGEADLGFLAGGRYRFVGAVEEDTWASTYVADADHGVYDMERVPADE